MTFEDELVKCMPRLYKFAKRLRGDTHDADDLVQNTIERAINNKAEFSGGSLRAWMFTIMANININKYRTDGRRGQVIYPWPADEDGNPHQDVPDALQLPEEATAHIFANEVAGAFRRLPYIHQQAIKLVTVDGYKYKDAATLAGTCTGTIRSRLNRGREALRNMLKE